MWKVEVHRKRAVSDYASPEWVDLDAMPVTGPDINGCAMRMICATPEEAVDFALRAFDLTALTDYDAIAARFRARYPHCVEQTR